MEFMVCIKQVPDSMTIDINPETGSLIRESAGAKINPYDLSAIEAALQVREKTGGNIHALTMGPKQARFAIREALALEIDNGWIVTDKSFAGSDVLATAYTLSQAILNITEPDIIFCGKQSTDGDTAQVGPEIAELLGIPHASYVTEINHVDKDYIIVTCNMGTYKEVLRLSTPCLVCIEMEAYTPRISSLRNKISSQNKAINELSIGNLKDKDKDNYGYKGSPTKVRKIYVPKVKRESKIIDGDVDKIIDELIEKLNEWGCLNE
jgi:electron transfer flavoprotein beta subunit